MNMHTARNILFDFLRIKNHIIPVNIAAITKGMAIIWYKDIPYSSIEIEL